MMKMITKLLVTFFVFSISINLLGAPVADKCVASSGISNEVSNNQKLCSHTNSKEILEAKNQQDYSDNSEKEALAHIRLSKRQPSIAESLMTIFFIPGLILLWFSRFMKSNK